MKELTIEVDEEVLDKLIIAELKQSVSDIEELGDGTDEDAELITALKRVIKHFGA